MFNYYEIEISGKYVKNLFSNIISNKISMYDIKYNSNKISFKVTYENYLKIKTIKTTCNVSINKTYGKNKLVLLFNKYKVFFISFVLSLIIIYLFSHMAFFIKINNNNKEINEILKQEMISNNLTIYSFKKPYKKLKNISNKIKDNNKDLFEWLEISTNGVYYEVDYIERKSIKEDINNIKHNIIASKNGLIKKLDIAKGSIVKNVGDYVSKNDLIVTGIITKNDEIKNIVDAKGKVYAEVWYKVKVSHPFIKKEYEKTNKSKNTLSLTIFGKEIKIFSFKKPIVTYSLIFICILVFILMYVLGNGSTDNYTLLVFGANVDTLTKNGDYYRLFTSMFLHIGILHLLCNMYSLYIVGTQVEYFYGKVKYIIIYLFSLIMGSLFTVALSSVNTVSAGASGAIFGLLGSILYFGVKYRGYIGNSLVNQIVPVVVLNLIIGFTTPGIGNAAHIGGLIGGVLITSALGVKYKSTKFDKINSWIVLGILVIFLVFLILR